MTGSNLLGIPETLLPAEPEVIDDLGNLPNTLSAIEAVVVKHPRSSLAWVALADAADREGERLPAYAYARVAYHRGLDALRKAGWRGQGPIPWSHEPNRGVLRAFFSLRRSAAEIGETDEVERLDALLRDADPEAEAAISALGGPREARAGTRGAHPDASGTV